MPNVFYNERQFFTSKYINSLLLFPLHGTQKDIDNFVRCQCWLLAEELVDLRLSWVLIGAIKQKQLWIAFVQELSMFVRFRTSDIIGSIEESSFTSALAIVVGSFAGNYTRRTC